MLFDIVSALPRHHFGRCLLVYKSLSEYVQITKDCTDFLFCLSFQDQVGCSLVYKTRCKNVIGSQKITLICYQACHFRIRMGALQFTKLAVHVHDRSTKDFIPNQCDLSLRERKWPLTLRRKRRHFFSLLFYFTNIMILHLRADDW